jgi:glycosyltransferase involved in cell wall biosynthesis
MPALNEEANIESAILDVAAAFDRIQVKGEVILVNDGSTDRTEKIVWSLTEKHPFIRIESNGTPQGIGASFWKGVKMAKGDIVLLIPGDGEVKSYEILRYLPVMDQVDVLVPYFYNREVRTWQRRLISKIYKGIINLTFGLLLNYMNGTVVYRRDILNDITLKSPGFFYQTELLIKVIKRGYLYAEVPCALDVRLHGKSTALKPKSFWTVVKGYFEAVWYVYIYSGARGILHPNSVSATRKSNLLKPSMPQQILDLRDSEKI